MIRVRQVAVTRFKGCQSRSCDQLSCRCFLEHLKTDKGRRERDQGDLGILTGLVRLLDRTFQS